MKRYGIWILLLFISALLIAIPVLAAEEAPEEAELVEIADDEVPLSALPLSAEPQNVLTPQTYTAIGVVLMLVSVAGIVIVRRHRLRSYDAQAQSSAVQTR